MLAAARTGAWAKSGGAPLPYDAEVDFLEATGEQYIEAYQDGLDIPSTSIEYYTDLFVTGEWRNTRSLWGIGYYYIGPIVQLGAGLKPYFVITSFGGDANSAAYGVDITVRHQISAKFFKSGGREAVVDGVSESFATANRWPSFSRTCLFANTYNNDMAANFLIGRIYAAKLTLDGVLTRDYIPCRFTNENGVSEGAMYDRVSGQLFRNQGTGAFVIGPDKVGTELAGGAPRPPSVQAHGLDSPRKAFFGKLLLVWARSLEADYRAKLCSALDEFCPAGLDVLDFFLVTVGIADVEPFLADVDPDVHSGRIHDILSLSSSYRDLYPGCSFNHAALAHDEWRCSDSPAMYVHLGGNELTAMAQGRWPSLPGHSFRFDFESPLSRHTPGRNGEGLYHKRIRQGV